MSKGFFVTLLMIAILLVSLAGCQQPEETSGVTLSPLQPTATVAALSSPLPALAGTSWPSGRVLYHADPTDVYQIYLVDNGGTPILLTQPPGSAVEPAWSPDKQEIAFSAYTTDQTNIEIYVMNVDGTGRHKVMEDQPRLNWHPDWSPDGTQLLFQSNRDGNFEVYRVNADGSSVQNLTQHPANDGDAAWSPDGSTVVFISDREGTNGMYKMAPDGSDVVPLLSSDWKCALPRWSPDGSMIAFASERDGTWDVYVMNADGTDIRQVTKRPGDNAMPDSDLLFTGEMGDLSWDLFLIHLDGTGLVQLTDTPYSERYPAWAP